MSTGIEWTDETSGGCLDAVEQGSVVGQTGADQVNRSLAHAADPRPRVAVPLRTVAGLARRGHVARLSLAAPSYGDDVIQSGSPASAAVRAETCSGLEKHQGRIGADGIDITATGCGAVPLEEAAGGFVPPVVRLVAVSPAPASEHLAGGEPIAAVAAPGEAQQRTGTTLRFGRTSRYPHAMRQAFRLQAITAASIGAEAVTRLPVPAGDAPLLTRRQVRGVVSFADAEACSSSADRAERGSSHLPIIPSAADSFAGSATA